MTKKTKWKFEAEYWKRRYNELLEFYAESQRPKGIDGKRLLPEDY